MTNIRRSALKRLVRARSKSPFVAGLSRLGLDMMGHRAFEIGDMSRHVAARLDPIFDASVSEVARPRLRGADQDLTTKPLPPIRPFLFEGVSVRSGLPFICQQHRVLLRDDMYDNLDRISLRNARNLIVGNKVLLNRKSGDRIPRGVYACGQGDVSWYHWLAEILPCIWLSGRLPPEFDDYPLLVPETALRVPSFRATLDLLRRQREIVALKDDTLHEVDRLVYIPPPVSGPHNMHDHVWPTPGDYRHNTGVMQQLRQTIIDALGTTLDNPDPGRVFLARRANARSYNQDEIQRAAEARGFKAVQMEKLSFRDQINLMYNADAVIGPTGAAFTNTLFMKSGSKSLVWALREYAGGCFFSNLAHVSGCDMTYCFVDADAPVASTFEAFSASYTLPVEIFCEQVDQLLEVPEASAK